KQPAAYDLSRAGGRHDRADGRDAGVGVGADVVVRRSVRLYAPAAVYAYVHAVAGRAARGGGAGTDGAGAPLLRVRADGVRDRVSGDAQSDERGLRDRAAEHRPLSARPRPGYRLSPFAVGG